jgi:hypothetical protein
MANVAFRVAAVRVAAKTDQITRVRLGAHDIAGARQAAVGIASAAIAILAAEVTVDTATLGRLADENAGQGVGRAETAAACIAARAQHTVFLA